MDKLISAEHLIQSVRAYFDHGNRRIIAGQYGISIRTFEDIINNEPEAFSKENVINELLALAIKEPDNQEMFKAYSNAAIIVRGRID